MAGSWQLHEQSHEAGDGRSRRAWYPRQGLLTSGVSPGHLPDALNVPLDRLARSVAGLREAGERGQLVHPAFPLLSAVVGGGLVFSAVSGTCGLAGLPGRLPSNRRGAEVRA
ncbi:DUF2892 domain-containing protein [Streptomyces sp. NPDC048603]|uniref:YgaP family membrane protein n=1 Tax=Streptomyces sp. NPDC048603 TaxID=3365577 RepID=UPI00371FAA75